MHNGYYEHNPHIVTGILFNLHHIMSWNTMGFVTSEEEIVVSKTADQQMQKFSKWSTCIYSWFPKKDNTQVLVNGETSLQSVQSVFPYSPVANFQTIFVFWVMI